MNKEDTGTFSITFKTSNDGYAYITNWLDNHVEVISNKVLPDTSNLYESDDLFKKLVKNVKEAQIERDNYINKNL